MYRIVEGGVCLGAHPGWPFFGAGVSRGFVEAAPRRIATGEKGIGFKAVFQVSDRPEIHSNGYHFRFDKGKHGAFGTVIPEWIEGADESAGTSIILPLRKDYRLPPDFLKSLQPELLLFLR